MKLLALKSYHISCPAALKRERHLFHFSVEKSETPARLSRAQIIPQRHRERKRNTCLPHWPLRYRAGPTAGSGHEAILSPCLPFSTLTSTSSGAVAGPDWQRRGLPREEIRRNLQCRPDRYENATAVDEQRAPQVEVSGRRLHLRRALPHAARTRRRLA